MSERKAREFWIVQWEPLARADLAWRSKENAEIDLQRNLNSSSHLRRDAKLIHVREVLPDDELERLRAENERLTEEAGKWQNEWALKEQEYLKLREAAAGLREALEDIAFRVSTSPEDKDGGPCRIAISNDRNKRILTAKDALAQFDAAMKGRE